MLAPCRYVKHFVDIGMGLEQGGGIGVRQHNQFRHAQLAFEQMRQLGKHDFVAQPQLAPNHKSLAFGRLALPAFCQNVVAFGWERAAMMQRHVCHRFFALAETARVVLHLQNKLGLLEFERGRLPAQVKLLRGFFCRRVPA